MANWHRVEVTNRQMSNKLPILCLVVFGLAFVCSSWGNDLVKEIPIQEEDGKPVLKLDILDGGSFCVPMNLQNGERKCLWLDRSFVEIDLGMGEKQWVPRTDGDLYWGTDSFEKRIPFKGSELLVESMIRAIQEYLALQYPDEDLETILFEKEKDHFALILDRLHKMNRARESHSE